MGEGKLMNGQSVNDLYAKAIQSYQAGNLADSENFLRQILAENAEYAPALHVMGLIGLDVERYEIAEEFVGAAIVFDNQNPSFYLTMGRILNRLGRKEEAIEFYKKAIDLKPDFTDAINNLGTVYLSLGNFESALKIFNQILENDPKNINALCNVASILYQQANYKEAIVEYKKALKLAPSHANIYHDIGLSLQALGENHESLDYFLKSLECNPHHVDSLLNAGNIYRHNREFDKALTFYSKIKSLEPNEYTFVGIAFVYLEQRRYEEALLEAENAEKIFPDSVQLKNFLGTIYNRLSMYEEALACYDRAIELQPNSAQFHANKATTLKNIGKLDEAIKELKTALSISPEAWIYSNLLLTMIYSSSVSPEDVAQTSRDFGEKIADPKMRNRPFTNTRNPNKKLKIGYLSPDFRHHAVSYFLGPIYKYSKDDFEIFAYSKVEVEDDLTPIIKKNFDYWRDIKYLDDDAAVDLIEKDGIDILVDLAGHTAHNGLMIFARKPAPIQIAWLGYTATTGMKAIDYRMTDPYIEPYGEMDHLSTENLWRLPDVFCVYAPYKESPGVIDHPPCDDNGYITFGCFNNFTKVTDPVLDTWARILERVPGSKLFLEISGIENDKIKDEIINRIVSHGIPIQRLILEPHTRANQFVLYNKIDIALDPFPAVGGTTSMDTLWMGVPFVTLAGKHFASRMGVTVLTNAGLPELIAQNTEEYIEIAVNLATDIERLRTIRHGLRERVAASPLMDQERFARNWDNALRQMWQKWVKENP